MSLVVVHVDNHLLAVVKPAGLPTVPDASGDESLLERAKAWVKERFDKPGAVYLGVVHRLDRPVSGVLLFARTSKAAARLTAAFAERRVLKTYWAVLPGPPPEERGLLEQWLVKDRERNRVTVVAPGATGSKRAVTRWRVLERGAQRTTLVELVPETGRPHQLRLAMAGLGLPILGDLKYGAAEPLPDQSVALHARALVVPHPVRDVALRFEAPPPDGGPWVHPACDEARHLGARAVEL